MSRLAQDLKKWEELYASGARPDRPPSAWVVTTLASLPNDGLLLDVAGGTGRHAVPAAEAGHRVVLVDFIQRAVRRAVTRDSRLTGVVAAFSKPPFKAATFGLVLVTNFLDRVKFPVLIDLIAPGGYLVYETYTLAHHDLVQRGLAHGPSSTEFLLRPGELRELAAPLEVVDFWEGEVNDEAGRRCCARLIGQKSGQNPGQKPETRGQSPEARSQR